MNVIKPIGAPKLSGVRSAKGLLQGSLKTRLPLFAMSATSFAAVPALQQVDLPVSQWIRQHAMPGDLEKAVQLSEAFSHGSGVIAIFLILLQVDLKNRKRLWNLATYVLVVGILANAAKYFLPRLRPNSGIDIAEVELTWLPVLSGIGRKSSELSFPSGHSATAVALAIALSLIYPRGRWCFTTIAVLAVLQRIYCGAHYPTDCMAGAGIAVAIACLWPWPKLFAFDLETR